MNDNLMQDWLAQRAARSPERVALIFDAERWTFRQLDARANNATHQLQKLGIEPGARVALLMGNSEIFVVLVHAIARAGAVLVPINTRLTATEIEWQLLHLQVGILLADESNWELARTVGNSVGALRVIKAEAFDSERETAPVLAEWRADAPHSILFTSGTTGNPKGAVLTFANHWWNAIGSALNLGLREDDVWLACMPLFHIGGLAILLRSVIYGAPVVLHPAFAAEAVSRAFDVERVTHASLVSTMLQRVIEARGGREFPETLRSILLGGGPAPLELLETCAALKVPVLQTYGLTEAASQVTTLAPEDALRKVGSAGKALMGVEVRIEGENIGVGEILIRGMTVMQEYANDPAATASAFRGGWFHTGDLGCVDGEGYLYVVSRRQDLIVSGGENIYPAEIEGVLNRHPAVTESAVVGISDDEWIQVPVAFVVLKADECLTEADLLEFCDGQLARFKLPRQIHFVRELPRNAAGKVQRQRLGGWVAEE